MAAALTASAGHDNTTGYIPGAGGALLSLAEASRGKTVLSILPTSHELDAFMQDVRAFSAKGASPEAMRFPMSEEEDDAETAGRRWDVAHRLVSGDSGKPLVIAACIQSLMQPVPDPRDVSMQPYPVLADMVCDAGDLAAKFLELGYERVPEVTGKRQFAVKGSLVDIWTITQKLPYRIESDGEKIESIRIFDPSDQKSVGRIKFAEIAPAASARRGISLVDVLPAGTFVFWQDFNTVSEYAAAFAENSSVPERRRFDSILETLKKRGDVTQLAAAEPAPEGWTPAELPFQPLKNSVPPEISDPDLMSERRHAMLSDYSGRARSDKLETLIFLDTEGTAEHLSTEIDPKILSIRIAPLSGGFEIPLLNLAVIAQPDIYGRSKRAAARRTVASTDAAAAGERLTSVENISPGDLVVHIDHGIGIYRGTTEIVTAGKRREVMEIEYAEDATLYVPISQSHLLSRYIGTGGSVRLHRLGSKRWNQEKAAAEKAVEDLASSLLETQAKRAHLPGFAFAKDTMWLHEFEASFPYAETPDQSRCIAEVKKDMISPHPMDRLVCGDAGYGKTEVAIRAAFICAMQGKQVAVLVPTTVLAQQHYDTFRERMAAYPVRIAMHSRFSTAAEKTAALRGAADGTVDILIGTHGLLEPGVRFKDIGLVIIDEEQRFGVKHKEYFKTMKQLVDVLTLSATPIPRTLHLGLTGVRDLSLLQTPPFERVATETVVARDEDDLVRAAITRELDRGGQVFYLYNRILTIGRIEERLKRIVPNARVAVGHGQMPSSKIEKIMRAFVAGEYDVLLCTTIIESGVDIPRANTIIVDRADRFGIADLYQLRGRVGRGSKKGHAVFLTPPSGVMDSDARERLKALRQNSGTGSGFQLALKDLGIRGAGNLLGAAQSGHIAAVGFSLYCQLLRQTVAKMKGEAVPRMIDTAVSMDKLTASPGMQDNGGLACIPYGYIDDEPQRIASYRRISECTAEEETKLLLKELADRFGTPPDCVKRLFRLTRLRIRASGQNIRRLEVRDGNIRMFRDGAPVSLKNSPAAFAEKSADAQMDYLLRLLKNGV